MDLQLELIDDWRVRLLQLLHQDYKEPLSSFKPLVLNAIYYVETVLEGWGVTVVSLTIIYIFIEKKKKKFLTKNFLSSLF